VNLENSFVNSRKGLIGIAIAVSVVVFLLTMLLVSIFRHKTEAKNPYLRLVEVKQATTDSAYWGNNWPIHFEQYKKTANASRTNFGGGDADPAQKSQMFPFLTRMFSGYAFSLDFKDRRGHAYMLSDQEKTRRVTERPQSGACLHCHASIIPTLVRMGGGEVAADQYFENIIWSGFEKIVKLPYHEAHKELEKTGSLNPQVGAAVGEFLVQEGAHPVSCTDCHNAKTMRLQVNRPGFVAGIRALKASEGVANFDVNRDASRAEMRTYVCAQCHVEYYCGPKVTLFFPWGNGVKVEEIESYYEQYKFTDGHRFFDWQHGETSAELLKAQHPEFELWRQGIHAQSGVACADCHMPYTKEGAIKVSDHYVRSPLLMANQSCQQCHAWNEKELQDRVAAIQKRNFDLLLRAGNALTEFLDSYKQLKKSFSADKVESSQDQVNLNKIAELHRKAQWRLDFVAAENSMGFHAPQEAARILAESIDYFRQAQLMSVEMLNMGHRGSSD